MSVQSLAVPSRRHRTPVARLALAALAALLVLPATASAIPRSCGWQLQPTIDQANVLYPDEAAKYWVSILPIPPGGSIELTGRYPHARYFSFVSYTATTAAVDGIADTEVRPDKGSHNPFLPGAPRTYRKRDYTVRIVPGRAPADPAKRAPNTIYTTSADGKASTISPNFIGFAMRIYRPDRGRDISGGVGLPKIAFVTADGRRTAVPECPDTEIDDTGVTQALAGAGARGSLLPDSGLFARRTPVWQKFTNFPTSIVDGALGGDATTDLHTVIARFTAERLPRGGLGENVHNKYVQSFISTQYGEVLVLRGTLPRTAKTFDGERRFTRDVQLRYWSLCSVTQATNTYACLNDDQVPLDRRRRYTIVVSTAAARPVNATERCGIGWLPMGAMPQGILILRNMLPSPGFTQSVQAATLGTERRTMGRYLPTGSYIATREQAEARLGCPGTAR